MILESIASNQRPIEVRMPRAALTLFTNPPLKEKAGDTDFPLAVTIEAGKSVSFRLSGKTGEIKFRTDPKRCSGAHHEDIHVEC